MKESMQMNARTKLAIAGLIGSAALGAPVAAAQIGHAQAATATDTSGTVVPAVDTAVTLPLAPSGSVQAAQPLTAQPPTAQAIFSELTHEPQAGGQPTDSQGAVTTPGIFAALFAPPSDNPATGALITPGPVQLAGLPDPANLVPPPPPPPGTMPLPPLPPDSTSFSPLKPDSMSLPPWEPSGSTSLPLQVLPHPGVPGYFGPGKDPNGNDVLEFTPFDGSPHTTYQPGDAVMLPGGTHVIMMTTDPLGNPGTRNVPLPLPDPHNFDYPGASNGPTPDQQFAQDPNPTPMPDPTQVTPPAPPTVPGQQLANVDPTVDPTNTDVSVPSFVSV
jgi:hypothetical protein